MSGPSWSTAALALLAVDPGLGVRLRGPAGPGRDEFLQRLRASLPAGTPWLRLPANTPDDRLLGGLDLAASLATGTRMAERGLLARADGGLLLAAMAERMDRGTAARIAMSLDTGTVTTERDGISATAAAGFGLIALDEGTEDEAPPPALLDRLAFWLPADSAAPDAPDADALDAARANLPFVALGDDTIPALVGAAAKLGVAGLRAPMLALRAARAAAAFNGHDQVTEADLSLAAALILAPRATRLPDDAQEPPPPPPPPPDDQPPPEQPPQNGQMQDRVLDAARAAMPADLLARLASGMTQKTRGAGGSGAARKAATRGRPVGFRPGQPGGGKRLHVLATLRAAAPWSRLRGAAPGRIAVRRQDFQIRRFREETRSTTIFVVDASGSAALNRLAEAKGAVESLLAECYIRRDRVALLAVKGRAAQLLLPPTSSLARAKKCLSALPGGGGTPLATGIQATLALADTVMRAGQTPVAVFLTDGRANISLSGAPGRPAAEADALSMARAWQATGHAALMVDTSPRPSAFMRTLAQAAGARYLALPAGTAGQLSAAIKGV